MQNQSLKIQKVVHKFANTRNYLYLCNRMIVIFEQKMIANNLKPFQPTHPGEVLKDELEYRGISQRGLAKEIGISYSAFNEMLNGKRSLSPELAMMMEAALGVDAAPLLAMQNEYDMLMAERDDSFMEKLKRIRRIAAIF